MQSNTRLVKIEELDFLVCLQNSLFGRSSDFVKSWDIGDFVCFIVGNYIAGVAKVTGKCFRSSEPLWLKNEYPFRIPIVFTHVFPIGGRPFFGIHKERLINTYGKNWGNVFVLRQRLPDEIQRELWENIESCQSDPGAVLDGIKSKIFMAVEEANQNAIQKFRDIKDKLEDGKLFSFEEKRDSLVLRLLEFVRNDPDRFDNILKKESFCSVLKDEEKEYLVEVGYNSVKEEARKCLERQGLYRPLWKEYGEGVYIVCGDSHGDHTYPGMFRLLKNLNSFLKADRIFHIGHLIDDNGIINDNWMEFSNLTIVSRIEEAFKIEEFVEKNKPVFEVVRDGVFVGPIKVANQDLVNDYMTSRVGSQIMRKKPYMEASVLNHHTHEFDVIRTDDERRIVTGYPGCLCEKHVESLKKKIVYQDGILEKIQRESPWFSRIQRRKWAIKDSWEQGVFIIHVAADGSYTIVPCRIRLTKNLDKKEYATSYFDKIITESGIEKPDKKIFINADIHAPLFDNKVLHVQDQVVRDYRPDVYVNLGDTRNSDGLNHHKFEKREVVTERILDEGASVHNVLRKMSKWAKQKYVFFGNHERFARDFTQMYPQFQGLVDFEFLSGHEQLGYELIEHQGKLDMGEVSFIHGDLMKGASVCPLEKLSEAFPNRMVVCGHHHYPSIRNGCYSIGYSGLRHQGYNEKTVTRWCHGFGLCNEFRGLSFLTTLVIDEASINLNGKTYSSSDGEFWRTFRFKIELNYIPY